MTNVEALEILNYTSITVEQYYQMLHIAEEALEKQIPKNPIVEKDKVMFGIICGNCPVCGSSVYSTTNLFCHRCGQALDWRETE